MQTGLTGIACTLELLLSTSGLLTYSQRKQEFI